LGRFHIYDYGVYKALTKGFVASAAEGADNLRNKIGRFSAVFAVFTLWIILFANSPMALLYPYATARSLGFSLRWRVIMYYFVWISGTTKRPEAGGL
jgi:hypothetical protein